MAVAVRTRRHTRRRLIPAWGLLLATIAVLSLSLRTANAAIAASGFAGGDLHLDDRAGTLVLGLHHMLPGDSVSGSVQVRARDLPLRYALTSSTTGAVRSALAEAVVLVIRSEGTSCVSGDGDVMYSGPLPTAAFGDASPGQQEGDRVLAAGRDEVLCFEAVLPATTGNALQATSATSTLTLRFEEAA